MMENKIGALPRAFNSDLASYPATTAGYPVVKYRQQESERRVDSEMPHTTTFPDSKGSIVGQ